jgi:hypothetical protein
MTDALKIRIWKLENKIKSIHVAEMADVHVSLVSHVITGRRKNKKVIEVFEQLGCPKEYFDSHES